MQRAETPLLTPYVSMVCYLSSLYFLISYVIFFFIRSLITFSLFFSLSSCLFIGWIIDAFGLQSIEKPDFYRGELLTLLVKNAGSQALISLRLTAIFLCTIFCSFPNKKPWLNQDYFKSVYRQINNLPCLMVSFRMNRFLCRLSVIFEIVVSDVEPIASAIFSRDMVNTFAVEPHVFAHM